MPVEYLSDQWLDTADELLRAAGPLPAVTAPGIAVETVVVDAPAGLRRYVVRLGPGGASIDRDTDATGDVRITQPWSTAIAIARGERSAQAAFLAAEVQVGGDVSSLIAHAGAVAAVGDLLAPLRAETVYP